MGVLQKEENKKIKGMMKTTTRKLNAEEIDNAVKRMYQDEVEKKHNWYMLKQEEDQKIIQDRRSAV
jgi:hypothetical protein